MTAFDFLPGLTTHSLWTIALSWMSLTRLTNNALHSINTLSVWFVGWLSLAASTSKLEFPSFPLILCILVRDTLRTSTTKTQHLTSAWPDLPHHRHWFLSSIWLDCVLWWCDGSYSSWHERAFLGKDLDVCKMCNSDHTGDKQTRRSHTGYLIWLRPQSLVPSS